MAMFIDGFLHHVVLITSVTITLLGTIFVVWTKYTRTLFGKDFWVVLPLVGKMAQWKKMTEGTGDDASRVPQNAGYVERTLVVPAEMALFHYYDDGVNKTSRVGFLNAREYLKISGQNGRRPMTLALWSILGVLTVAEAFGTGLLLAPLLSAELTPSTALLAGTALSLVIAIIAVKITHAAGEDLFANTLLAKVRNSYKQNKGFRRVDGTKAGDFVNAIGPEDDQAKDASVEPAGRLAARIGATSMDSMKPRRMLLIAAGAFIVLFAVATTAYRHYVFNKQQDTEASAPAGDTGAAAPDFGKMFGQAGAGSALPNAVAQAAHDSDDRAQKAIAKDSSMANDAGIFILTLIYVFTQLLGLLTGYKYSFFNEDAELAYAKTLGQLGYEDFLRLGVRPVAQRAQMRLGQLRSALSRANPGYGDHMRPFDYMTAYRESLRDHEHDAAAPVATPSATVAVSSPAPQTPQPAAAAPIATPPVTADPVLETVARELVPIQDAEARQRRAVELIRQHGISFDRVPELKAVVARLRTDGEAEAMMKVAGI